MDRDEALRLLEGGPEGVAEWNRRREAGEEIPNLSEADLTGASLFGASLDRASLVEASLDGASLDWAWLDEASLDGASLDGASLVGASLVGARLVGARLDRARCGGTIFADVDLSEVKGLDSVEHIRPSTIGIDTLFRSRGKIPEAFLRGCGLVPWEILSVNSYDPALTPPQFAELQCRIFDAWTKGRSMINGCFISYSWEVAVVMQSGPT